MQNNSPSVHLLNTNFRSNASDNAFSIASICLVPKPNLVRDSTFICGAFVIDPWPTA